MVNNISVIIPTLNGGELFHKLLGGIKAQKIDAPVEIVVVDSGSTDETVQLCIDYGVKLIQIPAMSFSHGNTRNLAISAARGDICVLTVQDAVPVGQDWLAALVAPLRSNIRLAGVFGRQVSCPGASSLSRCCKKLWYREWRKGWRNAREQLPIAAATWSKLPPEQKRKSARFDNVNSCIRKSVWEEVPFPDIPYAEDIAWAIDVLTSGHSIFWQPEAKMFHSHERPLAYELKRSYVDMKNLAKTFGESSPGLDLPAARTIFDWLAKEARHFLLARGERIPTDDSGVSGALVQGDVLWQRAGKNATGGGNPETGRTGKSGSSGRVKNMVRYRLYQSLAGPKWLRVLCRNSLFGSNGSSRTGGDGKHGGKAFLLELKGRHRFLLNQLLRIYYSEEYGGRDEAHLIRLGAAAMVAGSMLGQYSAVMASSGNLTNSYLSGGTFLSAETPFWHLVGEWQNRDWESNERALEVLDRLLAMGV